SAILFFTLSLHDALPIFFCYLIVSFVEPLLLNHLYLHFSLYCFLLVVQQFFFPYVSQLTRAPLRFRQKILCQFAQDIGCCLATRSEEHTSELQSRENLVC